MNENLKSTSQDVLDSDPSPDKRERSVTIPVAKLWWAAVVVLLTLAVSAYPYVCLVRSGQSIEGSSWWIVVFSVVNVITAALVLWYLFRSNKRRSGVLPCFIPALMIAFVGGVGALPGGGTQHATVFMCLFALGMIHFVYNVIADFIVLRQGTEAEIEDLLGTTEAEIEDQKNIFAYRCALPLLCLLSFVALNWKSMEMWWVPVVVLGVCLLLFCCLMVFRGDELLSTGMLTLSSILIPCVCFVPWLWYSIVYTAAEYATYHDMPAVVDICLPKSPNLSPCQRAHFPGPSSYYRGARNWYEKALKYAVQHGDVRASRAYLRIIDSEDLNHQISKLGRDVNLLPLLDWDCWPFGRYFSDIDLEYSAVVKQMSYDEPEMLDSLIQKSEAACIEGIMEHNAYKNALFLIRRKGCNARYATSGCCEKYTLLQSAVESRNLEMAELLWKNGADPDYAQDGDTPRRMAEKMNWQYVLNMFGPEPSSAQ